MTLLWDQQEPVGICVFTTPPLSLRPRNQFFNRKGSWTRLKLQQLNRQIVMLSRIVLHPDYRGLGLAHRFVRASCQMMNWAWIECLSEMGHFNPFLERAGFQRIGSCGAGKRNGNKHFSRVDHSALYGTKIIDGQKRNITKTTHEKSRYARPVYYLFDNRKNFRPEEKDS